MATSGANEPSMHHGTLKPFPHEELNPDSDIQIGRAKDPVKYLLSIEQRARERQVAYETVKLLREDVIECYRKEGVNHRENCHEVNEKYYNIISKKDLGQLQPKWKDPKKMDGW